jgi:hypothetical protein
MPAHILVLLTYNGARHIIPGVPMSGIMVFNAGCNVHAGSQETCGGEQV